MATYDATGPALLPDPDHALHALVIADCIADFIARDGVLVGFELVGASWCLPAGVRSAAERTDGENLGQRTEPRLPRPAEQGRGLGMFTDGSLRIVALNVRSGGASRAKAIATALAAHEPDIVVVGEAYPLGRRGEVLGDALAAIGLHSQAGAHSDT
ncbi:MAG TPA: hypothetical protein VIK13_07175, partial [Candidatus Limnocylindrales bacterium]